MQIAIFKRSISQMADGTLKSNLGDLLRSTVLQACLDSSVFWITDGVGKQILSWFIPEKQIVSLDEPVADLSFVGTVYYLDNFPPPEAYMALLCRNCKGFILDDFGGVSAANPFMNWTEPYRVETGGISWQESLIRGCGFPWIGQDYPLPVVTVKETASVGLNHHVHHDWKSKRWHENNWQELILLLEGESVSRQQGVDDLSTYIRWVASNRLVVTCDTFALHLASALRKPVVALVGPTDCREFSYGRVHFISPQPKECMPCNRAICFNPPPCMSEIAPTRVADAVLRLLKLDRTDVER